MTGSPTDGVPRVSLRLREDEQTRLVRRLQLLVLSHPVAARALFSSLVAEGRRFARTPAGRQWHTRLTLSPLLRRARAAWDTSTLWMLQEDATDTLPSIYLDGILGAAQGDDLEGLLDRVIRDLLSESDHAHT